jgi:hypothetical protein
VLQHSSRFLIYLRYAHYLSLDVVAGAVICHIVAQRLPNGHGAINWLQTIVLGIAVFVIYTLDRILDAQKTDYTPTPRHEFIKTHQVVLRKILIIDMVFCGIACFWISPTILVFGVIITALVSLYLWLVYKANSQSNIQVFKEIIITLLYTASVWGSTLIGDRSFQIIALLYCISFGLIVFQNLLLFSWMEAFVADKANSLAITLGEGKSQKVISAIFVLILVANFLAVFFCESAYQRRCFFMQILMALGLFFVSQNRTFFLKNERYRWAGDSVFWLMMVML